MNLVKGIGEVIMLIWRMGDGKLQIGEKIYPLNLIHLRLWIQEVEVQEGEVDVVEEEEVRGVGEGEGDLVKLMD